MITENEAQDFVQREKTLNRAFRNHLVQLREEQENFLNEINGLIRRIDEQR